MTGREAGIACVLATVVGGGALAQITPSAPRADQMHEQFRAVTGAQDAIVRGDLEDARHQARTVAAFPDPADLPPGAAPHLAAMRAAAGQAAEAADLRVAAAATAAMLANCGSCHRAVGTMPAHRAPPEARVGGVIGHMITHQAAMDLLLQGLVTPSTSLWNQGADALAAAPLAKSKLPGDAKVTSDAMQSEKHIHALAGQARQAGVTQSRVAVYSELIQSCADCHGAHMKRYGPGR